MIGEDVGGAVVASEGFDELRERIRGRSAVAGDPEWEAMCRPWQVLVDQRPLAVVEAADVPDVVETVRWAAAAGVRVAVQSTGHGAGALAGLDGAVLLRTAQLDDIRIDAGARIARIGAGAVWGSVAEKAAEHGLAAVAGMASTVGVVGFLLGGGLGWLARSHGMGSNALISLEAVDAEGNVLSVDESTHPDLLWAARGGALPLVVTSVTIRLHPLARIHAGALIWPLERAREVAHAWREWSATTPDSVTSLVRVLRLPPLPEVSEPLRGGSFAVVEAALQGGDEEVASLLAPLRALDPVMDGVRPMSPAELAGVHGDPPRPSPAHTESVLVREIDERAVDALLDAALSPASGGLVSIELRQLGGAVSSPGTDGAVTRLDAEGIVAVVGIVPAPEALEPVRAAAAAVAEAVSAYADERMAKTFADRPVPPHALYGDGAERLGEIARRHDPRGLLLAAHPPA